MHGMDGGKLERVEESRKLDYVHGPLHPVSIVRPADANSNYSFGNKQLRCVANFLKGVNFY
jgi:hypothetical protein